MYFDGTISYWTEWRLSRVHDQLWRFIIPKFKFGLTLAITWYAAEMALCLNPGLFLDPWWNLKIELEEQVI